ncbi:SCO2525 family SAM-dependent methyltransferase [Actinospica robiniae]|uniref:SCO2525 family SAM-dependent methyltransferase n=1 Tax=Actinospica robiniae TaxID=304901 RepID=UPI0004270559|nr:SCO2525 family SAM-dependent methyltransferase [Actinospica robiniae]
MAANADYDWNAFDAWDYVALNYAELREDDRRILELTAAFFAARGIDPGSRAVDVGTGANLYPALAMLPFCSRLSLLDFSDANIAWLGDEVIGYSENWNAFWDVLLRSEPYRSIDDPRAALRERAVVRRWNILEDGGRQWDLGTMFFVAESITAEPAEFQCAVRNFGALLKPGAPFAAAFMESSIGCVIGGRMFPAVGVDEDAVRAVFKSLSDDLVLYRPDEGVEPLREGYTGMILVHGTMR